MSTNSDLIKIEKFDPDNTKGTTFKNWKQSVTMLIYSQERLSKFLDNEAVPPPAPVANETAEARELRVEKHNSDGYKSALLIRQNVVQVVQEQLDIQWSAHKMMEHLTNTYGGTITDNLAVKWEEYHSFNTTANENPTVVISKVQKLQKDMEEICSASSC
ncbi:hypothetical protein SeLEV6574_g08590 [Synchytrium endobioticum]|uniref:Uncharacterized protein n=1 Tax=Synchytrium endobioticum TaxID=286115 RepID=A0A507BJI5_9FUNG|nr:hypothetical protein SeLEV6574_g08590 [Synchytrium endobioticum]